MLVTDASNWPVLIVSATADWKRERTREGIDIIVKGVKRAVETGTRATIIYRCTPDATPTFMAIMAMIKALVFNRRTIRDGLMSTCIVYNKKEDLNFVNTLLKLYRPSRNIYVLDANEEGHEEVLADAAEGKAVDKRYLLRAGRHV